MTSAFFALFMVLTVLALVIFKSRSIKEQIYYCRKSELESILASISEDCYIQIRIGRKTYEHKRNSDS